MPTFTTNNSPTPNVSEKRDQKVSAQTKARLSRPAIGGFSSRNEFIATRIRKSSKRCLAAANLVEQRLEILAQLDYKPLFSGQNSTLAGEMFDLRVIERASDIEAVQVMLDTVQQDKAEDYTTAVNQYKSVLTATEADFALLKMLILLREYATHTGRFLDFMNEYEPPEDLDLSFLGETTEELISNTCMIDFSNALENATQVLVQLVMMLNCSSYGLTPKSLVDGGYIDIDPGEIIYGIISDDSNPVVQALYDIANISRDLTFSREMVRIRDDLEPDEEYKQLIEETLGSSFVTSANSQNIAILSPITGTSAFSNLRTNIENQSSIKRSFTHNYLNTKTGVLGSLKHGDDVLISETNQVLYGTKTYDTIDPLVDDAFSGVNVLDFTEFTEVIDNFTSKFQQVADFAKVSFRLLEKASDSDGDPRGDLPLVQEEQPLSMASISTAVYEVFNRRFASSCWNSISRPFTDWLEPEHINYTKAIAWILIRDNPQLAREVVGAFINDYENGQLTVAGLPEPIEGTGEVDDDGNEIEGTQKLTELVHVKPGTTTPVNLTGIGAQLNGKIGKLNTYFQESLSNINPSNIVSQNEADYVSFPGLRTQFERQQRELTAYFGDTNHGGTHPTGPAGDLRLVNCMWLMYHRLTGEGTGDKMDLYSVKIYMGSKIVVAEIIDAVLDVVRSLISPFAEVPAASDGDPVFPFVDQMKNPYGTNSGYWGYSGAGYDAMSFSSWVNTINEFNNLFTRTNDNRTYMRRQTIKSVMHKVIDIFAWMMDPYDFLSLRKEEMLSQNTSVAFPYNDTPNGVYIKSRTKDLKKYVFVEPVCVAIKYNTNSSVPLSWNDRNALTPVSTQLVIQNHIEALSDILTGLVESSFTDYDSDIEEIKSELPRPPGAGTYNSTPRTVPALNSYSSFLQNAKREDMMLAFQYDFMQKYAQRVSDYKQATIDLVEGEGSPLGEFVTTVRELGDAGTDLLQNLTVNQLALKQVALEEERADEENAYLPKLSVISQGEINSVKSLCDQNILKSPEGNTTKVLMVGIPLNTFEQNKIENDFCLRVSYRDIEYPQLVFRSKSYKFDKDLYVLPEDLNRLRNSSTFDSLLNSAVFSRIRVEVQESNDTTASIQILDEIKKIRSLADERTSNRDIFSNLLVSEIMKLYYRIMLGLNFSETSLLSTSEELSIPISPSSATLAQSMASNISSLYTLSTGLASNVEDLINGITAFENPDDFSSGPITPVDAALYKDLANAYQTRLFSPEVLRNRTLAAKMFDRIYAIPVDPDEFYVVPPGQPQVGQGSTNPQGVVTPPEIFDYYLNAGIIERTELSAPYEYKLAPRRSAEGSMALGSVTVAMTTVDDEAEGVLGL